MRISEPMSMGLLRRHAATVLGWAPHSFAMLSGAVAASSVVLLLTATGAWIGTSAFVVSILAGLAAIVGTGWLLQRDAEIRAKVTEWAQTADPSGTARAALAEYQRRLQAEDERVEAEIAAAEGPHHR